MNEQDKREYMALKAFRDSMVRQLKPLLPEKYHDFPAWPVVIDTAFSYIIKKDPEFMIKCLNDAFMTHVTEVRHKMCENGLMDAVVDGEGDIRYVMTDKYRERYEKKGD